MPRHIKFDDLDKRAFAVLDDDFVISSDGETATVTGEMEVTAVRPTDGDQFWLTIKFPGGEELDARIARTQLLQELGVES
jgi:hypothetical protein